MNTKIQEAEELYNMASRSIDFWLETGKPIWKKVADEYNDKATALYREAITALNLESAAAVVYEPDAADLEEERQNERDNRFEQENARYGY